MQIPIHTYAYVQTCQSMHMEDIHTYMHRILICSNLNLRGGTCPPASLQNRGIVVFPAECIICRSALQCVAVCCSVLQCDAVCCSLLQSVAVCFSVTQNNALSARPRTHIREHEHA